MAEVNLNGKWLIADATFDKEIDPERAKDWNGKTHAMILGKKEILKELGTRQNLDSVFKNRKKKMESLSKQK